MTKALIRNGKVIQLSENAFDVAEGLAFVDVNQPGVSVGWQYDGTNFSEPNPFQGMDLEEVKQSLKTQVKVARDRVRDGGMSWSSPDGTMHIVLTDDNSRANLIGTYMMVRDGYAPSHGISWRMADNSMVLLTPDDLGALAVQLMDRVNLIYAAQARKEAEIDALSDIEVARKYNTKSGFPIVPDFEQGAVSVSKPYSVESEKTLRVKGQSSDTYLHVHDHEEVEFSGDRTVGAQRVLTLQNSEIAVSDLALVIASALEKAISPRS